MKRLLTGFIAYVVCFAMFIPALLSTILGTTLLNFWDWWESRFIIIAFLAFIPFFITAASLKDGYLRKIAFNVSGAWMILWSIPDMYANYFTFTGQFLSETKGYMFGIFSLFSAVCNVCLYVILVLRMREPKQRIIIKQTLPGETIVEKHR